MKLIELLGQMSGLHDGIILEILINGSNEILEMKLEVMDYSAKSFPPAPGKLFWDFLFEGVKIVVCSFDLTQDELSISSTEVSRADGGDEVIKFILSGAGEMAIQYKSLKINNLLSGRWHELIP